MCMHDPVRSVCVPPPVDKELGEFFPEQGGNVGSEVTSRQERPSCGQGDKRVYVPEHISHVHQHQDPRQNAESH